ncbi:hypothetical protein LBMAG53_05250 [Planctomycetota bacterium]|nr:hypothetical protein LBMAG53_05250 [Planctomycetota bacterium]
MARTAKTHVETLSAPRLVRSKTAVDAAMAAAMAGLRSHARQVGRPRRKQSLAWTLGPAEKPSAALYAEVLWDWMYVKYLWVAPRQRRSGFGAGLMNAAEQHARTLKLTGIWVDTFSFQAPEFYRRLGFLPFGQIEEYPRGERRIFFSKRLS